MKKEIIPGILVTLIELVISAVFMIFLFATKMIPNKMLLLIGGCILIATIVVFLLTMNLKHKVRFALGILLIVVMAVCYVVGGGYMKKGVSTLSDITKPTVEKSGISIYVRQDDKAETLEDTKGYPYGVLKTLDRENTDLVLEKVEETIGTVKTEAFDDVFTLVDGLLKEKTVDAIVLNNGFLSLLEEREDFEEIQKNLKCIYTEEIEKEIVEEKEDKDEGLPTVFSVYISGIDSREGLVARSRSDVNIIATINMETHQVLLVSTPRDFFVPLSISNGIPDKLTHAGIYGIDVSMDTLEMLYQTDIDYYFRVNFSGFEQIIDALGGITVMSDYAFESRGCSFVQGENQLNGEQALVFARERYSFTEGDRQRGRNQMAVISSVINKAMSPALLKNYSATMESLAGSFETNVPYDVIAGLVRKQLSDGGAWSVESYSVNGTGATEVPYSMSMAAYVMVPDMNTVNTAIDKMNRIKVNK